MPPQQFTIRGHVRSLEDEVQVLAYDRDMRAEQLLGDAIARVTDQEGRFEISFTDEQFRRAEKRRPDLILRVALSQGPYLRIRQLDINGVTRPDPAAPLFNAPPECEVLLIVEAVAERGLSEYEHLVSLITPLLEDLPFEELTGEDLSFLAGELELDQQVTTFLRWLRAASDLAGQTDIAAEAFYGWARTGLPDLWAELQALDERDRRVEVMKHLLDQLARTDEEALVEHLLRAVDGRIVPSSIRERAIGLARALRRRAQHELKLRFRLENEATGEPLAGYTVTAFDAALNNRDLGTDVTDTLGEFALAYFAEPVALDSERNLRFRLSGPTGTEVAEVAQGVKLNGDSLVVVRVPLPDAQPTLQQLRGDGRVDIPDQMLQTLEQTFGIKSLADIRRRGGLGRIAESGDGVDPRVVHRLDAFADLARLSGDLNETSAMIEHRYDSVIAIAEASRDEFIKVMSANGTVFSETRATELHIAAQAQVAILDQVFAGLAADFANGFKSRPGDALGSENPLDFLSTR